MYDPLLLFGLAGFKDETKIKPNEICVPITTSASLTISNSLVSQRKLPSSVVAVILTRNGETFQLENTTSPPQTPAKSWPNNSRLISVTLIMRVTEN